MKQAAMGRRGLVAAVAGALLALAPVAQADAETTSTGERAELAPLYGTDAARAIAGAYIVVLSGAESEQRAQEVRATAVAAGATITGQYGHALKGFAATLPAEALEAVRESAGVEFVEADSTVSIPATPDEASRPERETSPDGVQRRATWGLDRVDQRLGGFGYLDGRYRYGSTGAGVTAYVIDTGIRITHADFEGRARHGFTSIGSTANDCNGHGTHVAGTVGGQRWGVAKDVGLVAVRVLNCKGNGTTSGVIEGIDWVTGDADDQSVANLSLGGSPSVALDNAVAGSIAAGITYAVAAGNSTEDACNFSPARVGAAITVGATDDWDWDAWFSNWGTCLDLFAPGDSITSAWKRSDTAKKTISGTSMAAPHVAGAAALYVEAHPAATPQQVRDAIVGGSTPNKISFVYGGPGSPNRLLFSRLG